MTHRCITEQSWFADIKRPSRYLGNEINAIHKPRHRLEIIMGLAFPDVYEVGMSHQGLKILYHLLNRYEWLAAERVFCPWVDLEAALREHGFPLQTLESGTPLGELDILGFSLQHELCYTNVLTMLDLAGIPFRAARRDERHPLVIAGGPACFNPEPVADFFDAFLVGDGEEAAVDICRLVRMAKQEGGIGRKDLLARLTRVQGLYIPSLFAPEHAPDGRLRAMRPLMPGYHSVHKALVPDIEQTPYPAEQVVPFSEPVHDRLAVEICRGCTRGCRFCQAGMIYRPVRERSPEIVLRHVKNGLQRTGYDEVSLLSLSSGDYSAIGPLLTTLMDRQSRDRIAVSLPSLRIDSLDEAWFEQIKRVRKTGFTLAPEAGTDRLRRIINKTLTHREILETARKVYGAGWNLIKLYFMIGLPGETEEDVEGIVRLSREVMRLAGGRGKKPRLHVSVATFVPKPHTPFMWCAQIPLEEARRRIRMVQDGLRDRRVRVKWNSCEMSWLEGLFSRGDRRLGDVLVRAWRSGARFDAWGEHFRLEQWEQAFEETRIPPAFYLYREREENEILPWTLIHSGVRTGFLRREWERAMEEKTTPDCRTTCLECGVCDHERIDPIIASPCGLEAGSRTPMALQEGGRDAPMPEDDKPLQAPHPPEVRTYVLTFTKSHTARYLGHLEFVRVFTRALRRADLPMAHTGGFHPTPKISFTSPLPVGTESLQETAQVALNACIEPAAIKEGLNQNLPSGVRILYAEDVTGKKRRKDLRESRYEITLNRGRIDVDALEAFLAAREHPVTRTTAKGTRTIDAKARVKSMRIHAPNHLELVLLHLPGPSLKPAEILTDVLNLSEQQLRTLRILKTGQVLE